MNIKPNLVILAALPVIMGITPAFAQSNNNDSLAQKTTVQVNKQKEGCKGGACQNKGGRHMAFAGRKMGFRHHRSLISSLRGEYALTDAQAEKMIALKSQFRQQAKPKFEDLISTKRKLTDLITQPNADQSQLMSLQKQIDGDRDALSDLKLQNKEQQLSLLTDSQKQEIRHEYLQRAARFGRG